MSKDVQRSVKRFEDFIEDVLKADLKQIESTLEYLAGEIAKWRDVRRTAKMFQTFTDKVEDDLTLFTQLFAFENYEVHAKSEVEDLSMIIVDIGCNCLLEMDLEEASKYAEIRMRVLEKHIEHNRKLAVNVKVNIKLTLLAINELGPPV